MSFNRVQMTPTSAFHLGDNHKDISIAAFTSTLAHSTCLRVLVCVRARAGVCTRVRASLFVRACVSAYRARRQSGRQAIYYTIGTPLGRRRGAECAHIRCSARSRFGWWRVGTVCELSDDAVDLASDVHADHTIGTALGGACQEVARCQRLAGGCAIVVCVTCV